MAIEGQPFPLIHKYGKDPVNVIRKSFPGNSTIVLLKKSIFINPCFQKLLNDKCGLGCSLKDRFLVLSLIWRISRKQLWGCGLGISFLFGQVSEMLHLTSILLQCCIRNTCKGMVVFQSLLGRILSLRISKHGLS